VLPIDKLKPGLSPRFASCHWTRKWRPSLFVAKRFGLEVKGYPWSLKLRYMVFVSVTASFGPRHMIMKINSQNPHLILYTGTTTHQWRNSAE
jgi:hypothetical protein